MSLIDLIGFTFEASKTTLGIFFLTLLFGLPLGLLLALGRMSKLWFIRKPIQIYNLIMRGTPLILQLYLIYFAIPRFCMSQGIDFKLDRFVAAIIGFSLNYAAYFSEIYRGGIQSIPKGQYEAATVLGFSKYKTFFKIILPQVVKQIIPPMSNEFMTLVKDTSLAYVIGNAEIFLFATDQMATSGKMMPLIVAGGFYLLMNIVVERVFVISEKRLDYYR